jgi:hypothetical protein
MYPVSSAAWRMSALTSVVSSLGCPGLRPAPEGRGWPFLKLVPFALLEVIPPIPLLCAYFNGIPGCRNKLTLQPAVPLPVMAYLGLVPSEHSSGIRVRRLTSTL